MGGNLDQNKNVSRSLTDITLSCPGNKTVPLIKESEKKF
jgi:hypothetical protein